MTERDQRLQEIRDRYEASSVGDWMSHSSEYPEETYVGSESTDFICENLYDVDAEFIAHAHQDIPWLLAEIERLVQALGDAYEAEHIHIYAQPIEEFGVDLEIVSIEDGKPSI